MKQWRYAAFLVLFFAACAKRAPIDAEILSSIAGCWRGSVTVRGVPRETESRLFSPGPDGGLVQSLILPAVSP